MSSLSGCNALWAGIPADAITSMMPYRKAAARDNEFRKGWDEVQRGSLRALGHGIWPLMDSLSSACTQKSCSRSILRGSWWRSSDRKLFGFETDMKWGALSGFLTGFVSKCWEWWVTSLIITNCLHAGLQCCLSFLDSWFWRMRNMTYANVWTHCRWSPRSESSFQALLVSSLGSCLYAQTPISRLFSGGGWTDRLLLGCGSIKSPARSSLVWEIGSRLRPRDSVDWPWDLVVWASTCIRDFGCGASQWTRSCGVSLDNVGNSLQTRGLWWRSTLCLFRYKSYDFAIL